MPIDNTRLIAHLLLVITPHPAEDTYLISNSNKQNPTSLEALVGFSQPRERQQDFNLISKPIGKLRKSNWLQPQRRPDTSGAEQLGTGCPTVPDWPVQRVSTTSLLPGIQHGCSSTQGQENILNISITPSAPIHLERTKEYPCFLHTPFAPNVSLSGTSL